MVDDAGEPAVRLIVVVRPDRGDMRNDGKMLDALARHTHVAVDDAGVDLFPYTRFVVSGEAVREVALHDELLAQADRLAHIDETKPKQATLRRAVSSAYHALFHLLVDQGHMKKAARAFAASVAGQNAWRAVLGAAPSVALVEVALAFSALQEARHEADYDLARSCTRGKAAAFVARARDAFTHWDAVAGTPEGEAFPVELLVGARA